MMLSPVKRPGSFSASAMVSAISSGPSFAGIPRPRFSLLFRCDEMSQKRHCSLPFQKWQCR